MTAPFGALLVVLLVLCGAATRLSDTGGRLALAVLAVGTLRRTAATSPADG